MWFELDAGDLSFCDHSPHRIENVFVLDLDPEPAFDLLTSAPEARRWLEGLVEVRFTSPPPYGIGTTREVTLQMMRAKAAYIAWQPGERLAFTITATTLPIYTRAVEDLHLAPAGPGATRVRWTVHYEMPWWMRPLHPLARLPFARMFRRSAANLVRYAREREKRPDC